MSADDMVEVDHPDGQPRMVPRALAGLLAEAWRRHWNIYDQQLSASHALLQFSTFVDAEDFLTAVLGTRVSRPGGAPDILSLLSAPPSGSSDPLAARVLHGHDHGGWRFTAAPEDWGTVRGGSMDVAFTVRVEIPLDDVGEATARLLAAAQG